MLHLILPDISHKEQWEEIMREWRDNWRKNPRVFFQESFEKLLEVIDSIKDKDDLKNQIPQSLCYFLCEQDKVIGMYVFRYNLNFWDDAINGGHIGYGIRPTEREKGYGKEGLRLVLEQAKKLGFLNVFISCDDDNIGSVKIIEANGGKLERYTLRHGVKGRRYSISL